jgi:hypothetical protein
MQNDADAHDTESNAVLPSMFVTVQPPAASAADGTSRAATSTKASDSARCQRRVDPARFTLFMAFS